MLCYDFTRLCYVVLYSIAGCECSQSECVVEVPGCLVVIYECSQLYCTVLCCSVWCCAMHGLVTVLTHADVDDGGVDAASLALVRQPAAVPCAGEEPPVSEGQELELAVLGGVGVEQGWGQRDGGQANAVL